MANPRQKFVDWLAEHDPAQVEQLVLDLHAVSPQAFTEICAFAAKLRACADPKAACEAARVEVEKRPTRPAGSQGR